MRSGRLLAEDEPSLLLNKYNQIVCLFYFQIKSIKIKKKFCRI